MSRFIRVHPNEKQVTPHGAKSLKANESETKHNLKISNKPHPRRHQSRSAFPMQHEMQERKKGGLPETESSRRLIPPNEAYTQSTYERLEKKLAKNDMIRNDSKVSPRTKTATAPLAMADPSVLTFLLDSLETHPIFSRLSESQRMMVAYMMRSKNVEQGTHLFRKGEKQGRRSGQFYILESGTVVRQNDDLTQEPILPGHYFGCRPHLSGLGTKCNIFTLTNCSLWALSYENFGLICQFLQDRIMPDIEYFLKTQVEPFESIKSNEHFSWEQLCNVTVTHVFPQSHSFDILSSIGRSKKGHFFIIFSGKCGIFLRDNATGVQRQIATLLPGQCFHTFTSRLLRELRPEVLNINSSSIVARPLKWDLVCLVLSSKHFHALIPTNVQDVFDKIMRKWIPSVSGGGGGSGSVGGSKSVESNTSNQADEVRRRSTYMSRRLSMYGVEDEDNESDDDDQSGESAKKMKDKRVSSGSISVHGKSKRHSATSIGRRISVQDGVSLDESMKPISTSPSKRNTLAGTHPRKLVKSRSVTNNTKKLDTKKKRSSIAGYLPRKMTVDMSDQEKYECRVASTLATMELSSSPSFSKLINLRNTLDAKQMRKKYSALIMASLHNVLVLRGAEKSVLEVIASKMKCIEVKKNTILLHDQSIVSHMSLICEGTFALVSSSDVEAAGIENTMATLDEVPTCIQKTLRPGDTFGQNSLLFASHQDGMIFAKTDGILWTISGSEYRKTRAQQSQNDIAFVLKCLQSHKLFYSLPIRTITHIVETFDKRTYVDGQMILQAGTIGSDLMLIAKDSGKVRTTETDESKRRHYSGGDFFGEDALVKREAHKTGYVAVGKVTCYWIHKIAFFNIVANVDQLARALKIVEGGQRIHDDTKEPDAGSAQSEKMIRLPSLKSPTSLEMLTRTGKIIRPDDFELIECIGIGAFGRVALARHRKSKNPYAIKQISKTRRAKRSRKDEIDIMQMLSHSNIAHLVGRFTCRNKVYIVLPFYNGGDLLTRLVHCRKLSMEETRYYVASTHLALCHIHKYDIIYRDLKLENLVLTQSGKLKLIDFGLAKRMPMNKQRTFTICGTVEYMSPEMITSAGYRMSLDIWALGVLFHEFVTGRPPFGDRKSARYQEVYEEIRYYTFRRKEMELEKNGVVGRNAQAAINHRMISSLLPYFAMEKTGDAAGELLLHLLSPVASMRPRDAIFKAHDFFRVDDFSWERLECGEIVPPHRPQLSGQFDTKYFDDFGKSDILETFFS